MSEKGKKTEEEFSFKCPSCKEGIIKIYKAIYDLKDGDKMLILKFECDKCNFSKNDVIPFTRMEPGIMTLKINNEEDLKSKIYRSPTGKLEIPELELSVEPGPSAGFYFTNMEGVLDRFKNAVLIYKNSLDHDDPQMIDINEILNNLENALKGQFKFTLKMTDKVGGSYIIPQDNTKHTFEKFKKGEIDENS